MSRESQPASANASNAVTARETRNQALSPRWRAASVPEVLVTTRCAVSVTDAPWASRNGRAMDPISWEPASRAPVESGVSSTTERSGSGSRRRRNRSSAAIPPTRTNGRPATANRSAAASASSGDSAVRTRTRDGALPVASRKAGRSGRSRSYSFRKWPELRIRPLLS